MKFQQLLKRLRATARKNNRKDIMNKKDKTDALKQLFIALNAEIETGDGFTSYTLDSKDFKVVHTDLSKLEIKGNKQ
jgi:hypothetical protein